MDKKTMLKAAAGAVVAAAAVAGIKAAIDSGPDDENETSGTESGHGEGSFADAEHYHIVPRGEEWALRKAGAERATRRFDTKKSALDVSRDLMQEMAPAVLVVHRADGTIETQHTYGVA